MAWKGRKATPQEAEAGAENLAKWRAENPAGGNLKHGAGSLNIRKRYNDRRTREARELNEAMDGLIEHLGGADKITAPQNLLLNNIRAKLIVLLQISRYVNTLTSIINSEGELIPCLGRNYTTYAESVRRDLEALFSIKRRPDYPSYELVMKDLEGKKS